MFTALIIEDDSSQRNALMNVLSEAFPDIHFFAVPDYITAVKLIEQETFDFFLLDIDLQDLEHDGIELGYYIRTMVHYAQTPILYLTYITDCIAEALNKIHCYHYICKPYSTKELISTVMAMLELPSSLPTDIKLKSTKGVYFKVKYEDIYFAETRRHQFVFHTKNGKYFLRSNSIKDMLKLLPDYFIQCHKSYIINTLHVFKYNRTRFEITIDNLENNAIPVGRAYKPALEERIGIK